jgi:hypothetical protein
MLVTGETVAVRRSPPMGGARDEIVCMTSRRTYLLFQICGPDSPWTDGLDDLAVSTRISMRFGELTKQQDKLSQIAVSWKR